MGQYTIIIDAGWDVLRKNIQGGEIGSLTPFILTTMDLRKKLFANVVGCGTGVGKITYFFFKIR